MNPLDNISVILVEPSEPGNIGATARVLKNTGLSRLILVNPNNWDTPSARARAHGANDILDTCQIYPDLPSATKNAHLVIGTTHRGGRDRVVEEAPREILADAATQARHQHIALVFGREKDGLWRREMQYCHHLVRFPLAVTHPSLNLSHAVLLFTYELFHAFQEKPETTPQKKLTQIEREHLYSHVDDSLHAIDFRPYNDDPINFSRVMRRVFNRTILERRDAMVLHRICSQIKKFAAKYRI